MLHGNFAYSSAANDGAGLSVTVSIFADRQHVAGLLRDDAEAAGFRVVEQGAVSSLLAEVAALALGEVVLLDCPVLDGTGLAALARLDLHAVQSGAQVIVSTSVAALDDVFGCLDQSNPQILVDPSRAERVIALGEVLAKMPSLRVRELSQEDRIVLLRLTEQVGKIAQRLERLETPLRQIEAGDGGLDSSEGVFRLESPRRSFVMPDQADGDRLVRAARPSLPDPRLVRRIIRQRQLRARFFDGDLFADPAWDMLLDLTAARAEHTRVSITSLCIASGVPPTTALRWIGQLIDGGMLLRLEDETDKRRAFITLSDRAADGMARYFAELGNQAVRTV